MTDIPIPEYPYSLLVDYLAARQPHQKESIRQQIEALPPEEMKELDTLMSVLALVHEEWDRSSEEEALRIADCALKARNLVNSVKSGSDFEP